MTVTSTPLEGVLLLTPKVFSDARGSFYELFNQRSFEEVTGQAVQFVQDNHSISKQGTIRGMHYQLPYAQAKLISVPHGEIYDVVVDLRSHSTTFGQWFGVYLSNTNHQLLFIPEGFAHGFLAISEIAVVQYKTSAYYNPSTEHCLDWQDPTVGIDWPLPHKVSPQLSPKDQQGLTWDAVLKF